VVYRFLVSRPAAVGYPCPPHARITGSSDHRESNPVYFTGIAIRRSNNWTLAIRHIAWLNQTEPNRRLAYGVEKRLFAINGIAIATHCWARNRSLMLIVSEWKAIAFLDHIYCKRPPKLLVVPKERA
jgi:hypothetical protein